MMSRCFSSSCLYLSTCAFSSSSDDRSRSSSARREYASLSAAAMPRMSFGAWPPPSDCATPPRDWEVSWEAICSVSCWICSSSKRFSSFSLINSTLRCSSARTASWRSCSARLRCSSISKRRRVSTTSLFFASNSARKRFSSRSYCLNNDFWSWSSLIFGTHVTAFARVANLRVPSVSDKASSDGEMVASMVVLQFPPSESPNNLVSLESR
mmetsp:Transcript_29018/g.97863  ORF Transcript_29018/g.97863 Transcript_29018/m.97863 type:complete len:211 (-) Transcript_29018:1055-1687(-)